MLTEQVTTETGVELRREKMCDKFQTTSHYPRMQITLVPMLIMWNWEMARSLGGAQ